MKSFLKVFAALFVISLIARACGYGGSDHLPSSGGSQLNSDPACVDLRARMAAPDAVNTITVEDLALSQRCGTK